MNAGAHTCAPDSQTEIRWLHSAQTAYESILASAAICHTVAIYPATEGADLCAWQISGDETSLLRFPKLRARRHTTARDPAYIPFFQFSTRRRCSVVSGEERPRLGVS
jgi:hypothetical protein